MGELLFELKRKKAYAWCSHFKFWAHWLFWVLTTGKLAGGEEPVWNDLIVFQPANLFNTFNSNQIGLSGEIHLKIFEKSECAAEEKYRLLSSQGGGDLPIPDWGRDRSILSSGCSVPCADIIHITIIYIIIYCAGCMLCSLWGSRIYCQFWAVHGLHFLYWG